MEAYERLCAEGFLVSRVGAGTFVRKGVHTRTPDTVDGSPLRPRPLWDAIPEASDLSATAVEYDLRPGLPDTGVDDRAVAVCAAERGVAVLPLSYHFVQRQPQPGLIVGYGAIGSGAIHETLTRVRDCVAEWRGAHEMRTLRPARCTAAARPGVPASLASWQL